MIKINLAKRKKASFVEGGGGENLLSRFNIDREELKELPLVRIGLSAVVMILASIVLGEIEGDKLDVLVGKVTELQKEKIKLNREINKIRGFEPIKAQLEKDEFTIRTKIETIEKLVSNRNETAQLLTNLSTLIPDEVWLDSVEIEKNSISISGRSIGFSTVSDFMKKLRGSAYFSELVLKDTQQINDITGLELAKFELSAKKKGQD